MRQRCILRCAVTIAALLGGAATGATAAVAAYPQALGAVSGDCRSETFYSSYSLPPTAGNHHSTIQKAQVSKAGSWQSHDILLRGADTVWTHGSELKAGVPQEGYFVCLNNASLNYTVTQYDTPTAPTSFSGAVTPGGEKPSAQRDFGSDLGYIAPGAAAYVADVTIAQGALRIGDRYNGVTVASSKTINLGAHAAGEQVLSLTAIEGPQAIWKVTVRPLPVQLTGLAVALPRAQPGETNIVRYTTNGDTQITVIVMNRTGAPVRTLATALAVGPGNHTLTWDGTDQNGRLLNDGVYTIRLYSADPVGNLSNAQTSTLLDGTPPKIAFPRSTKLGPKQAIIVRVSDAGVGLRSAVLRHRGRVVSRLREGTGRIVYRPGRGRSWAPGRIRYTVTATDKVGNVTARSWTRNVKR